MNVKELKEFIADFPDDMEIYVASDEEGNDFNSLSYISSGEYAYEDNDQGINWGTSMLNIDDVDEKEIIEKNDLKECLVIWP